MSLEFVRYVIIDWLIRDKKGFTDKSTDSIDLSVDFMAGRGGFEPPEVLPSPVFKTGTFDHSDISRHFEE